MYKMKDKINVVLLNGPCTKKFARTGRWQATSRGASLWYPIWLAYCASVLEKNGFNVRLIDAPAYGLSLQEILLQINDFNADLCIIDTSTASISYDLTTARAIKDYSKKDVKICMVGPHATALPEHVISNEFIDFVAVSEYDYTVRDLAIAIRDGSDTDIVGLWSKKNGAVKAAELRPLIESLDELPFASASLFRFLDITRYGLDFTLHPYMNIMTSRGCPSKCIYCLWPQTLSRGKYRQRSLDNVFEEIDFVIAQKPAVKELFFDDDTFTVDKKRVYEFCERYISKCYNIPFSVNSKANITDRSLLRLMKRAGLRCFVAGFESGVQEILNTVRKGTRIEEMREFAIACKDEGIQVHGDFVVGLPGETLQTIHKTVDFAKKLPLSTFQISIAHPLPGTSFYAWLDSNGYLTTRDFADWIDADGMQKCVIDYPELPSAEIEKAVYRAIKQYYLSLEFIKNAIGQIIRNPNEFRRYAKGGLRLLRFFINR